MANKDVVLLPAGAVLPAGDPPPPTKSNKAIQAGYWAGLPIFMAVVVNAFQQLGTFYPEAPDWVLRTAAYVLMIAGPILAYFGVQRSKDQLQQPIETIEGISLDGRQVTVVAGIPNPPQVPQAPDVPGTPEAGTARES
jgi:hypothetical protein